MRNLSLLLLAGASLALAACNDQSQQQKSPLPTVQSGATNVTADEIGSEGLKEYVGRYPKSETKLGAMMNFGARLSGGVPLAANSMSKNYYFVLDGSGSMGETECTEPRTKMDVAKEALISLFDQIPGADNVGLFVFDRKGASERVALATGNRDALRVAVEAVRPDYRTPLGASVHEAAVVLERQAAAQLGYGEYNLVVVTDGAATDSSDLERIVDLVADQTPINLFTVGFCIDDRHILNQEGRTEYRSALNPEELGTALKAVLAESEDFGDVTVFN
ncbi:VWA domain-containing protein [Roseibium sp. RKSG952]|uniref:vWA domain-containing protein n=1 Tax=Roseibium sp. RKSG952 TaxID=2529384 RepID=UPI0012BBF237|nr:vWA domain-containing protein [Roseibium sp. RKSG952]MTH95357.1 VWA domain-containing protein [Roseibium sp. RKSG952]